MSAINLTLWPERALVGVDTECRDAVTGEVREGGKLVPLPHLNAVMAGRGTLAGLMSVVATAWQAASFDALVGSMPTTLQTVFDLIGRSCPASHQQYLSAMMQQQIILVGFSEAAKEMRGHSWEQRDTAVGFVHMEIEEAMTSPWEEAMGESAAAETVQEHIDLLRGQVAYCKAKMPEMPLGGRLMLAELSRQGVTVTAHDLAPAARVARPDSTASIG